MASIRWFSDLGLDDTASVGAKNASLGEMCRELAVLGVRVPNGFATTADAYERYLSANKLVAPIAEILDAIDFADATQLAAGAARVRSLIEDAAMPAFLERSLLEAYRKLSVSVGEVAVAVRCSPVAPSRPDLAFAGLHGSQLMVRGSHALVRAVKRAFADLFTARAVAYRHEIGLEHSDVAQSVGVQRIVRADLACSGVMETLDAATGFRDVVRISAGWGLGHDMLSGRVTPDVYTVFKPPLLRGLRPIIDQKLGGKQQMLLYDELERRLVTRPTPPERRRRWALDEDEVIALATTAATIEAHFAEVHDRDLAVDIQWAKDGLSGQLFIVQAHSTEVPAVPPGRALLVHSLVSAGPTLTAGYAVGNRIVAGRASFVADPAHAEHFCDGDVLVTASTELGWEPIMRRAAALVTDDGDGTSHAATVAGDLGIPAVVATGDATVRVAAGEIVTVSCADGPTGRVYSGEASWEVIEVDPAELPHSRTRIMLDVGDPGRALRLGALPVAGVGLARMESILAEQVGVHPAALIRYRMLPAGVRREVDRITDGYVDKPEYFVATLARSLGTIAAAFYPRPVIIRTSNLATSEYAGLVGGSLFEPAEANPQLGWRGAARYIDREFRDAFELELAAISRLRESFGLFNVHVAIPYCRTVDEGRRVLDVMRGVGLEPGDGLDVSVMAVLPANILEADSFAEVFDGFCVAPNDLARLMLGVDSSQRHVPGLFAAVPESVRRALELLLESAHRRGRPVGVCGPFPPDPDFLEFLIASGIDSISLSPDALVATLPKIVEIEETHSSVVA